MLRRRNGGAAAMEKFLFCVAGLWLLCGTLAAFLVVDQRTVRMSDIAMGPISLAEVLR